MSISETQEINLSDFKPETVTTFKKMYSEKKEFLEHLSKYWTDFEKVAASLVINVATGGKTC
jgi:hypothetical protein